MREIGWPADSEVSQRNWHFHLPAGEDDGGSCMGGPTAHQRRCQLHSDSTAKSAKRPASSGVCRSSFMMTRLLKPATARLSSGHGQGRNPQRRNTLVVVCGGVVVEAPHYFGEALGRVGCVQHDLVAGAREYQMPGVGQRLGRLVRVVRRRCGVKTSTGEQHRHIAAPGWIPRSARQA